MTKDAETMLQVGLAAAVADGQCDERELTHLRQLARSLGVDDAVLEPTTVGLPPDLAARLSSPEACEAAYAPVKALREQLAQAGLGFPTVVAGGTPTFPMHARRGDVECSPGTCVLWDHSYATKLPDLSFQPAALVLTRVVSKPGPNRLCLDLGHKAIASENPPPRVNLLNLADAKAVLHSEEHLVLETPKAGTFKVGDPLLGIPWHICPTVALYGEAVIIKNGKPETRGESPPATES